MISISESELMFSSSWPLFVQLFQIYPENRLQDLYDRSQESGSCFGRTAILVYQGALGCFHLSLPTAHEPEVETYNAGAIPLNDLRSLGFRSERT